MLWAVAAAYAGFVAWTLIGGHRAAAQGNAPTYSDFTPTYAASLLVREKPAEYLYDPRSMHAAELEAARAMYPGINEQQARGVGFAPWMYPPNFILIVAPLASLPYFPAWLLWLCVTAIPYLVAIRKIMPGPLALPFALAAPPVFFNVIYGQTGFITAGLIGLGLVLLRSHPLWAGVLIGLASVKPHFGVLIPLALIAGGHWRAFGGATLSVIATVVASLIAYGDMPWFGFIGTTLFHLDGFAAGAYNFKPMTTVLSTLGMAGVSLETAWRAQYAAAALMAGTVAWAWWQGRRRPDTHGLQAAILCLATPLALPMTYLYDLVLIVPAAAWLWADMQQRNSRTGQRWMLGAALAAIIAVKWIAETFGVQIGAAIVAVLLGLALHRLRAALASTA